MKKARLTDKIFRIGLVLVTVGVVLPCSNYICHSQVLARSAEEYCLVMTGPVAATKTKISVGLALLICGWWGLGHVPG